jgi:regulator of sigma E protease
MTFALMIITGLLVLSLLVFVHELGHFIAAKACRFKVLAFAIGFGKPLFKWKKGDTEYRINAIPFGGYVAMAGNEYEEEDGGSGDSTASPKEDIVGAGDSSYPIWQRAVVALAGPAANVIFAVFALWAAFIHGIDRPIFWDNPTIGTVIRDTPGSAAGFKAGDSVISINGEPISTWEQVDIRFAQQLPNYNIVVQRDGERLHKTLQIKRTGARMPKAEERTGGLLPAMSPPVIGGIAPKGSAERILEIGDTILALNGTPVASFEHLHMLMSEFRHDPENEPVVISLDVKRGDRIGNELIIPTYDPQEKRYLLGIRSAPMETRTARYGPIDAIGPTMKKNWEYAALIFDFLAKLIRGEMSAKQLAGPLNIIPMSGAMAFHGLSRILDFMALISINLAVVNLLPLVITDGGLLVFLGIEAIRKKPLSIEMQATINKVFLALFIALFLYVTFNDLQRLPDLFGLLR